MKIESLPIERLIPYARNSRTHSDAQIAQVAASIREFGFTNPVLIDAEDGIIAGHGRVMAARKLGLDKVPCIRLAHLSETQKRAYIIADNKLALNAADCGVPQRRERVFFVVIRDDIKVPPLKLAPQHRWISAGEAVADLQVLTDAENKEESLNNPSDVKWWPLTKPGEDYGEAVIRAGLKVKLWNHKKLSGDLPSKSLTATDMFKHWSLRRTLTFREWKRLGSFPDDYHAKSDKIGKYMIGMSVPPKMTEVVARAVIDQWLQPK